MSDRLRGQEPPNEHDQLAHLVAVEIPRLESELASARAREDELRGSLASRHEHECACDYPGSGGCLSVDYLPLAAVPAARNPEEASGE